MRIYLKAKHWQLFIALVGSIFFAQAMMASSMLSGDLPSPLVMIAPTIFAAIVFFGWLWSVASACSKALPPELVSSTKPMQLGLIYALVYFMISSGFFFSSNGRLPGYIVVMHLLAMASIFYSIGFTAKQLVKLEQGKEVSFSLYSGSFFLFWFFPIGIWFIQPKINQLLGGKNA
ncbi:MAG: hypothetical protein P1U67_09450 [Alcanivoracaceae bacterium]|nr:hypothetical protein [Alcanivoracaceae bacterium]